jgi:hypothetical protein
MTSCLLWARLFYSLCSVLYRKWDCVKWSYNGEILPCLLPTRILRTEFRANFVWKAGCSEDDGAIDIFVSHIGPIWPMMEAWIQSWYHIKDTVHLTFALFLTIHM